MGEKSLTDFGVKNEEFEAESQALSQIPVGTVLKIKQLEPKRLGSYDGIVMHLVTPVKDKEGLEWDQVHSSSEKITKKLKQVELGSDLLSVTVKSGKTDRGTWYDVE